MNLTPSCEEKTNELKGGDDVGAFVSGDCENLVSFNDTAKHTNGPEGMQIGSSSAENLKAPEYSSSIKKTLDNQISVKSQEILPAKRPRVMVDIDAETSTINARKDILKLTTDSVPSLLPVIPRSVLVETLGAQLKRQRYVS